MPGATGALLFHPDDVEALAEARNGDTASQAHRTAVAIAGVAEALNVTTSGLVPESPPDTVPTVRRPVPAMIVGAVVSLVLGYVVYGLSVFFAYRDMKQLADRGVPKPFHWAFAFIGGVVYTIGRSVIVKRRTGRGHAPLWAEIAVFLLITALVVWIEIVIFSSMADMFSTIPGFSR